MKVVRIPLADLRPNIEGRTINQKSVETLAESMNLIGLLNPITVVPCVYTARGRADNPGWRLVAGGHRTEAAKMLGWEEIDAFVLEGCGDARSQRMVEISENLHRAELTALERDKLVAEWVELTGDQLPQNGANESKREDGRGHRHESGIRLAARQLPVPGETEKAREHQIARALKVASLSLEAQDAAREVGLDDNRAALLEARKQQTPEAQVESLRRRAETKLAPVIMDDFSIIQKQKAALIKAWEAARPEAREEFLKEVGER